MKKEEFENFETVKYWMNSLQGSVGTKRQWKLRLRKFCEWLDKTPDELIAERKDELKSEDNKIQHHSEMTLKRYLKFLEEKGLSPNARRTYFTAIRNFYQRNYVELKFFRRDGPRIVTVSEGAKAANKEDIRKMVEVSNPREKALILFIKDTGLSISDTAKLKLKNLGLTEASEIFEAKHPIAILTNRKKTGTPTVTFLGEEGLESLKTTLRIRMRGSPELKIRRYGRDEIKGGLLPEELTLESPLFRSYGKFLATLKKHRIHHLSPNAISVLIRKSAIQAAIWKRGFSAHALRRFFQTSLESAGINRNWIKAMMGHRLEGVEGSYSKPEIEMLKEAYVKAYPHLAITENAEQRSRVETLETQVEKLILNGKRKNELLVPIVNLLERIRIMTTAPTTNKDKVEMFDILKRLLERTEA